MSLVLQQSLQGLCSGKRWSYAVFWKIKHRNRIVITWEDGYNEFMNPGQVMGKSGTYQMVQREALVTAVAKMSYHMYTLGEGLIGRVAFTGKHQWIFSPSTGNMSRRQNLSEKFPAGWDQQFSSGIKTIALIGVPGGVVQLGSIDVVVEDLGTVSHVRNLFSVLQNVPGAFLSDLLHQGRNSPSPQSVLPPDCLPLAGPAFPSHPQHHSSSLGGAGRDTMPSQQLPGMFWNQQLVAGGGSSSRGGFPARELLTAETPLCPDPLFPLPQLHLNLQPRSSLQQMHSIPTLPHLPPSPSPHSPLGTLQPTQHLPQLPPPPVPRMARMQASALDTLFPPPPSSAPSASSSYSLLPALPRAVAGVAGQWPRKGQASGCPPGGAVAEDDMFGYVKQLLAAGGGATEDPESRALTGLLGDIVIPRGQDKKGTEEAGPTTSSPSLAVKRRPWEAYMSPASRDTPPGKGEAKSGTFQSVPAPLQEVVPVKSPPAPEKKAPEAPVTSEEGAALPGDFNGEGGSSASLSDGSRDGRKKRKAEGEEGKGKEVATKKGKPRPRDRQQIQDRVRDLREIIPNSLKCSIDNLLEKTIKRILFAEQALSQRLILDRLEGAVAINRRCLGDALLDDSGLSPFLVEAIPSLPNHMLVEVLCEGIDSGIEISESLRKLGLIVKKGSMEARDRKVWARYIVEHTRPIDKVEVKWQLMQVIRRSEAVEKSSRPAATNSFVRNVNYLPTMLFASNQQCLSHV